MAENKKGFILYADLLHVVNELTDKEAGLLFKHILAYVNDLHPKSDNRIVNLTFGPIKQQLKRDLEKFEETIIKKSNSGKIGNLKRWNPDLYESVLKSQISIEQAFVIAENRKTSHSNKVPSQDVANIAVNDTDNVTVTDNDNVINNKFIYLSENPLLKFSVGKNLYQGKPSELAKSNLHLLYLQNWLSGKNVTIEEFSQKFDEDFNSKMFESERHFQNSISITVKKIIDQKNENNKGISKPNSQFDKTNIHSGGRKDFE